MIPNWCYSTMIDYGGIKPSQLKTQFFTKISCNGKPCLIVKWYTHNKGVLQQSGVAEVVEKLPEGRVLDFIKNRWLSDIDTAERVIARWNWVPFIGYWLVKFLTRNLFKIPTNDYNSR